MEEESRLIGQELVQSVRGVQVTRVRETVTFRSEAEAIEDQEHNEATSPELIQDMEQSARGSLTSAARERMMTEGPAPETREERGFRMRPVGGGTEDETRE